MVDYILKILINYQEPVGSVAPKINTAESIQLIRGNNGSSLNILCPAQAFPKPVYRLVPGSSNT